MSKSPNKHNRLYAKGDNVDEDLCMDIEKGTCGPKTDPKERAKFMNETYGWEKDHCGSKLWSFGPDNAGANTLVDATKGV
jgi:elongation factor 2